MYLLQLVKENNKGLCNNYQEGGGPLKPEGGALHKIAAKIRGAQSKITHLTKGGGP